MYHIHVEKPEVRCEGAFCLFVVVFSGFDGNSIYRTNNTCMSNDVQLPDVFTEILFFIAEDSSKSMGMCC